MSNWRKVTDGLVPEQSDKAETTEVLDVKGGWLYRTVITADGDETLGVALAFVPDPERWAAPPSSGGSGTPAGMGEPSPVPGPSEVPPYRCDPPPH